MEIIFERDKLYDEVWSEPLTKLAKKYGLSDNGLRKVCKAMNIPLPQAGHWAKVAAGHRVGKIPLPATAERTTFVSHPTEVRDNDDDALSQDKAWCQEREAFESQPENLIVVDLKPRRWHPAIAPLTEQYRDAANAYEAYQKHAEKPRRRQERPQILSMWSEEWRWSNFVQRGKLLIDTHKAIPVRVSILTYERALAILNTLAWEAEKRNFSVSVNADTGRIQLDGYDASLDIRMAERLEESLATENGKPYSRDVIKAPTGKLRLFVERRGSNSSEVGDEPDAPLETRLNAVFVKVYRSVVRERERGREWAAWRRQRELEAERQEEIERRRREEARRVEEERQRRTALETEATNWRKARLIREYVTHVLVSAGEPIPAHLVNWQDWALRVASELDPTPARCEGTKAP